MNKIILSLICTVGLTACGNNKAEEPQKRLSTQIDSECRASQQSAFNSGQTSKIRNAMANVNTCLENNIKKEARSRLGGNQSLVVMDSALPLLGKAYQGIMWEIATEDVTCRPNCGSISQLEHLTAHNSLLLDILDRLLVIPSKE